jgi:large subunit ribosomal protein L6
MSRLAKKAIIRPKNVEVKVADGKISTKGPKGQIDIDLLPGIDVEMEGDQIFVKENDALKEYAYLGLIRARLLNAVVGVEKGFEKRLTLIGVGFKAQLKGTQIELALGYSHPCLVTIPQGIQITVDKGTSILISGYDKQAVGQLAATIRSLRPPEPYKGKGVRYENEYVRKKAGKTAKK